LQLSAFLRAESPCDVLVAKTKIDQLPLGSVIGTSSMRRKALLKKYWPHLLAKDIRGNIETRLKAPGVHGVILSEAGLLRMGYKFSERLDAEKFVPAPGQGVIVLETRADAFAKVAAKINDADQEELSRAELKLAHGFDCSAPLGIYARKIGGKIRIKVFLSNSAMDRFFEEDKDQNQWTTIPSF
jgi:hydroxymethylbilane synthase